MRNRTSGLILVLALGTAGCAADVDEQQTSKPPTSSEVQVAPSTESQIYAAVLRRLVLTDHTFGVGDPSPFKAVYVIDHRSSGISDSFFLAGGAAPLDESIQSEIERQSEELPLIEFIDTRESRIDPGGQGLTGVVNDGVVVGLSAISTRDDGAVEVGAGFWCGVDCGFGTTYLVENSDGWHVTENIGPTSIS
ncbi:hypothetical protein [Rhodococcus sp. P1Y]|uniref:hypothetical protein n=1 Tax=Rhodococcus sp. P1Y TaxID=1302308 RepID=UPI000EAC3111|nr:hypothetical protein [Rhodococcus sp. P1Y]AYJ47710.1 hypothetical protein D8W71_04435 [Rhodococcus sp. P1Y]